MFDLMASAQAAYNTGELQPYYREVLLVVAAIYFTGAFSLGRYGGFLERRMAIGR
jgi:general L-amino acid transport system permease protein